MEWDECAALILRVISRSASRKGSVSGFVGGLGEIPRGDNVEEEFGSHGGCDCVY